ncbi:hypothetical protein AUEXF2481DRAFT_234931 [Aureobasidium subglaciale EXF-2481]|uniref:Uncharacterized protein n=1 Tax=Aureobasidium subglaciale (strain EXF-2481) TaxID=1043005 RepID=A0A074YBC8_AURSE|nr:uncharacterized protein AUEXF2481DRAFT_234931 [Aureobasidium subglaciale EXF-2481]KEQ95093.1 hypothetical protein AUEXF2481DRAFT_234931 [Aureobasidium subglaciale EXF-2481]
MIDQADALHEVFEEVKESVNKFLNPLRKQRGDPPLDGAESPAESVKQVEVKSNGKRALSPDPFLARFKRAKTDMHADDEDKHRESERAVTDGNGDVDSIAEDRNNGESDYEQDVDDEEGSEENYENGDDPDGDSSWGSC